MYGCSITLSNCRDIRKKCGVRHPTVEVCKIEKRCPCWNDKIGCRAIGPPVKVQ